MTVRAEKPQKILLEGDAGVIECVVEEVPDSATTGYAVVCHPHPLFGGTMDNKVVHTLSRSLHRLGVSTVRFNFRGVGESEGEHDEGRGETDDAVAVIDWAKERFKNRLEDNDGNLWLAGFSFGAWIAVRAAARRRCRQLVTIAPPVERFAIREEQQPDCPWLIVQGSADELVDSDAVVEWVNELRPGPALVLLPDVDHFFHGALTQLRDTLIANLNTESEHAPNT